MKVLICNFGCSTNQADGEVLAGCLTEAGYELVNSVDAADVVVYNTCAVKGPTENRVIAALTRIPSDKKLVVAGCLPLINFKRLQKETRFDGVVGPAAQDRIVDVVKRVSAGQRVYDLPEALTSEPALSMSTVRSNPFVSTVPVSYGCLGSCAYCCVVHARGRLRSCGIPDVLERVKKDVAAGVREVWLTSQDMACYGLDKGSNLPELLTSVCDVQGQFKIRVGMMTPNHAKGFVSNLIDAFRNEKIFKFVHLPLQSGDDEILKRMRRFYSAEDFKETVRTFRESFPEITVETDVICGFPGESEEAFQHTMRSIAEVRPDIVNVSKFFARPKTEACRMEKDFVSPSHIKQRTGLIAQQAKKTSLERNQRWIGWTGEIIVDEVGKVKGTMVGRNFVYKPVVVTAADSVLGKTLHVRIAGAFSTYLEGEVVSSRRRTLLAPEVVDSL